MSPEPDPRHGIPLEPSYSLDLVARVSGISSQTVLRYHEQGLIRPAEQGDDEIFDDETVHRLRHIERLRESYGMDLPALKLTLGLMDEIERLRAELRFRA